MKRVVQRQAEEEKGMYIVMKSNIKTQKYSIVRMRSWMCILYIFLSSSFA